MADAIEPERAPQTDPPFIADGIEAAAYNEEGVDLTLIRMFLRMTPAERLDAASAAANAIYELRALHAATPR